MDQFISEHFAHLTAGQQDGLRKLMSLMGLEAVTQLLAQGPDAVNERLEAFSNYENALLEHIQQGLASSQAAPPHEGLRPRTLKLSVDTFLGKEGENLLLWIRAIELAMDATLLIDEQQSSALSSQSWAVAPENGLSRADPL